MKVLDIFLPLSPAQAIVVEKAQILANTFGENEQKTELRIASLLLKNKSVSAAKQARSFNQFVELIRQIFYEKLSFKARKTPIKTRRFVIYKNGQDGSIGEMRCVQTQNLRKKS